MDTIPLELSLAHTNGATGKIADTLSIAMGKNELYNIFGFV